MPLKKIDDDKTWTGNVCRSLEHSPPSMMVYKPGTYEWTCPTCGHVTRFTVPPVTCGTARGFYGSRRRPLPAYDDDIARPWRTRIPQWARPAGSMS